MQQKWVKVTAVILAALMAVSGLGVGLAALIKLFFTVRRVMEDVILCTKK